MGKSPEQRIESVITLEAVERVKLAVEQTKGVVLKTHITPVGKPYSFFYEGRTIDGRVPPGYDHIRVKGSAAKIASYWKALENIPANGHSAIRATSHWSNPSKEFRIKNPA